MRLKQKLPVTYAGNNGVIVLTILTDKSLNITANYKVLFTKPVFTRPGLNRVALVTTVKDLSKVLNTFQTDNVIVEHVYDY